MINEIRENDVCVVVGDIFPGIKKAFLPTIENIESFSNPTNLQNTIFQKTNYANPCELYQTILDGKQELMPENLSNEYIGIWGTEISNDDGTFSTPYVLTLVSENLYSSKGISFVFDEFNGIFCNDLSIEWYNGESLIAEQSFYPNKADYFCEYEVKDFNKVVVTFKSINMPKNRFKIYSLEFGYGKIFVGREIKNITINNLIDPISTQLSVNTCNIKLNIKESDADLLVADLPLDIYKHQQIHARTFIKNKKRTSEFGWDLSCEDAISKMENVEFLGGVYFDKNALELLEEIFSTAKVNCEISPELSSKTVSGHIPITNCRDALAQVLIAVGAVANTAHSSGVVVKLLSNEISQNIDKNRIMEGQTFDNVDKIKKLQIVAHTFDEPDLEDEDTRRTKLYRFHRKSGTVAPTENIKIVFETPCTNLTTYNCEIIESNANYAIIKLSGNVRDASLYGYEYVHSTSTHEISTDVEENGKEDSITEATLISEDNVQEVLQRCFDWLSSGNKSNMSIIEKKNIIEGQVIKYGQKKYGTFKYGQRHPDVVVNDTPVIVGDIITAKTAYVGDVTGRIIKETYSLGNTSTLKKVELR